MVAAGFAISALLRGDRTAGTDIGDHPIVGQVLTDGGSPQRTPASHDLTLAVFGDYRCPVCQASDEAMEQAVTEDGKVKVIYKEWPIFGETSRRAAQVALAADRQELYAAIRPEMMRAARLDDATLERIVVRNGGDWASIQAITQRSTSGPDVQLERVSREAFALGLPGTPAYLVGPILVKGALDKDEFHRVFARARRASRTVE